MSRKPGPITWVVKLGGSLSASDDLPRWLDVLAGANVVIVPGGGPFADQVREAQGRWQFDDRTAHVMAILAMAQYGHMLCGLQPRLRSATCFDEIAALIAEEHSVVWLPDPAQLPESEIPASWDVTSDSLAAWLAGRLGAGRLLLVKSAAIPAGEVPLARLMEEGVVDAAFGRFVGGEGWVCGAGDYRNWGNKYTAVF
ncbi:amino acid kinase family protein [Methylomagnum sp.]